MARIHRRTVQKKALNDPVNHNDVVTHLESDILECEVKWALGSITINKASGGDGIPDDLLQILKDAAAKVLHSLCQHIWKTQLDHKTGKGLFSFQYQRRAVPKNFQITIQITLISHASKILLKILQAILHRIAMSNLDSALKSRDITLPTKVCVVIHTRHIQ